MGPIVGSLPRIGWWQELQGYMEIEALLC